MKNLEKPLFFNKKRMLNGWRKQITSFAFLLILTFNVKSQSPYCQVMGNACVYDQAEAAKFQPDEYSPILTINLNFHFYQNGDVFNPMNFAETWDGINVGNMADGIPDGIYNPVVVTGSTYADAIVWRINNRLEFNPQMNLPVGNSTPNLPYKFRFRKNSVQYHTWDPTEGVPAGYSYPPNGDGIDIFFFDNDAEAVLGPKTFDLECGTVTVPDFPLWWDFNNNGIQDPGTLEMTYAQYGVSGYNSSNAAIHESWTIFKHISDNWCTYQNAYDNIIWGTSRQILHEVGHAFCLSHTMMSGNGTACDDCDDSCSDTPTRPAMQAANGIDPIYCLGACATNPPVCSNNLMDYCDASVALTPQQLGRWYYNLYTHHLYAVYNDYCQHDGSNTLLTAGTNVTWEGIRICKGDITVEAGAILTLKGRLWMPEHGKIIVKPGGRLYINGGCIGTLCDGLWEGIEVWGNSTLPQTLGNQGLVNLTNNALIEQARTAIRTIKNTGASHYANLDWTKTGGIIQATNANFKNNIKGIEFATFQNKNGQNLPINNISYFRNCLFETNDISHFDGTTITHGITMWGVNGIAILGCTFNYLVPTANIENKGNGILAGMSTFRILDYGNDRNEFLNLNRAIKATGPAKGFYPIIDHAKFINNRGGVLLAGFGLSQITRNNFNWVAITEPSNTPTYGLYLQECQGYRVEENYFDAADGIETFGVCVNNSGNNITQIYRNYFTNLHAASMVYNDNRKEEASGAGLQWRCNEYGTSGSNSNSNTYQIGLWGSEVAGIPSSQSLFQGTNPSISAGNKFYEDCTPNPNDPNEYPNERELKLMEQIDGSYYNYVHDNPALSTPLCRTPGIGLINSNQNITNTCPSSFNVIHNTTAIASSIQEAHSFEQQLKTAYDGYANNGTGPALKSILMDASKTSIEVRNALMDAAPKVTDELLLLALKRQPELEGWHMAQAMLANSPLRASVMNELAKSDYYPFYKALVQAGQSGGLTTRQLMEMDYAHFISSQHYDFDQLLQIQMNFEESEIGNWENLETQLTALDFMLTPSDKAQLALSKGDLNEAASQLSNCGTEENDYCECISVALELAQNGMTSTGLPNNIVSDLQNMASTSGHKMQATAELLLEFWGLGVYKELLELPEGATLRSTRIPKLEEIEIKSLGVNPNPADGIVYINYLLPDGWVKAEITVYDYLGKVSSKFDASQFDGIIEFDGQLLPAGVYLVELEVDNIKISSTKLTLVH